MHTAYIRGTGHYVPERRLTNQDLEQLVVTSDEWIVTRTGIRERAIAADGEATSDLAFRAARAALDSAGISARELDMIIVATETPDHLFPPVACRLQHMLGCREIAAFDLHLVCTGFVAALQTAEMYLKSGRHSHILVVGADILSRITDYADRTTCILFADGAGAVVLARGDGREGNGIIHSELYADGSHFDAAIVPGGGSRYPNAAGVEQKRKIVQDGGRIFKLAVRGMSQSVRNTLLASGRTTGDIDWLIPHQANQRIMDAVAEQLDFPKEKVISIIRHIGNNSAATIPIALDTAVRDGRIRRGQHIVLTAFGAGLAWGSALLQY
jgi:3-oxoacyl-[acyl-carrier-protein] synthase-3